MLSSTILSLNLHLMIILDEIISEWLEVVHSSKKSGLSLALVIQLLIFSKLGVSSEDGVTRFWLPPYISLEKSPKMSPIPCLFSLILDVFHILKHTEKKE